MSDIPANHISLVVLDLGAQMKREYRAIKPEIIGYTAQIYYLMKRSALSWNWTIAPEEKESIDFADQLRMATLEGRLKCVWCHVPNEGKRHRITATIMKAMGLIPGALDYWFVSSGGGCLIELKIGANKPTDNQICFMAWCDRLGVPKAVCYNKEDALQFLRELGLLKEVSQCPTRYADGSVNPQYVKPKQKPRGII